MSTDRIEDVLDCRPGATDAFTTLAIEAAYPEMDWLDPPPTRPGLYLVRWPTGAVRLEVFRRAVRLAEPWRGAAFKGPFPPDA